MSSDQLLIPHTERSPIDSCNLEELSRGMEEFLELLAELRKCILAWVSGAALRKCNEELGHKGMAT